MYICIFSIWVYNTHIYIYIYKLPWVKKRNNNKYLNDFYSKTLHVRLRNVSKTPQSSSCMASNYPSRKLSKLDDPDMQETAGEVSASSKNDVLLWTPSHGRAKAGQPARTYIQQLYIDTGCSSEDLPEVMDECEGRWWWWLHWKFSIFFTVN